YIEPSSLVKITPPAESHGCNLKKRSADICPLASIVNSRAAEPYERTLRDFDMIEKKGVLILSFRNRLGFMAIKERLSGTSLAFSRGTLFRKAPSLYLA